MEYDSLTQVPKQSDELVRRCSEPAHMRLTAGSQNNELLLDVKEIEESLHGTWTRRD